MIENWLKLYYNERIYLEEEFLTMENLVVLVFNTASLSVLADLKLSMKLRRPRLPQIALVKKPKTVIVWKERYDFEDSTTDAT